MKRVSRTIKYRDLRNELDSDKQAYFEHIQNLKEEERKRREEELRLQQETQIQEEEKEKQLKQEELRVKKEKHIKFSYLMDCVITFIFVILMVASTIMWKKSTDNCKANKVIGNEVSIYKYENNISDYIDINNTDIRLFRENDFNENDIAISYIKITNESNKDKEYSLVLNIYDSNNISDNYEYSLFMEDIPKDRIYEKLDYEQILFLTNNCGSLSNVSNLLLDKNVLNINSSNNYVLCVHKIDKDIKDSINIGLTLITE